MSLNILISALLSVIFTFCSSISYAQPPIKWTVYYGDKEPIENFLPYQLVVFEGESHPPLFPFIESDVITLGYLNLGEVEKTRDYFEALKAKGLLLGENKNWKDSFYIDIRDKYWSKLVVEELIPRLLFQHFNGLFLDTIDNATYLESLDPQKYKGMKQAAINLIKSIRLNYPNIPIMLNRGYEILPEVAGLVDYELAESLYTHYDFATKKHVLAPKNIYDEQVKFLQDIKKKQPNLLIFTLDYWDENDPKGISKIYAAERGNGFIPYVSTLELNKVVLEPK